MRATGRWRWVPPALWAAAILAMSSDLGSGERTGSLLVPLLEGWGFSAAAIDAVHGMLRAAGHVVAYGVFALLAVRAASASAGGRPRRTALLLALALSILDETLQAVAASHRTGDVLDVLLDVGAAAAFLVLFARRVVPTPAPD